MANNLSPYSFDRRRQSPSFQNYPPLHNGSNPSFIASSTNLTAPMTKESPGPDGALFPDRPLVTRTPSPSPSEAALLSRKGVVDWQKITKWRFWIRREWLWYYVIFGLILILVIFISVYDRQIVRWLQPTALKIKDLPFGWLIPIAIFFVISFPPYLTHQQLFGHEILAILCGVVWGLWLGFAIVCAGTFIGELGNFYAFKSCCKNRGEKLEKTDLQYACLAETVRTGGFWVALVARYSAIPGHFTTAVFSTCGMNVIVFAFAALLSLPKQFVTVYIGVILDESGTGTESTKDKLISDAVLAISVLITCLAMWYIYHKMEGVKYDVIYRRRKARQHKLERANPFGTDMGMGSASVFNPSESSLPLNSREDTLYQRWDRAGRASGYAGDPNLSGPNVYAPTPQKAEVNRIPTYRTDGGGGYSSNGARYDPPGVPHGAAPPAILGMNAQRDDSVDNASWDRSNVGTDAYRLPTIVPHSPFTGGLPKLSSSPVVASPTSNPFRRGSLSQPPSRPASVGAANALHSTTPLPAALPPPPQSPTHSSYNYQSSYPVSQNQISNSYATHPYGNAAVTASPSLSMHQQLPTISAYAAPISIAANVHPQAPVSMSHVQTPAQHFSPHPSSQVPQTPTSILSQQPNPYEVYSGTYQTPASPTGPIMGAAVPDSPSPYATSHLQSQAQTHYQEGSGNSVYYTPAHSRLPTAMGGIDEPGRLPTPTLPPPDYKP